MKIKQNEIFKYQMRKEKKQRTFFLESGENWRALRTCSKGQSAAEKKK